MKKILIILLCLFGIFALLYFSDPPKAIHYISSLVLAILTIKTIYSLLTKK